MLHKIAHIYRYIREQESEEATELIINLLTNLNSNNTSCSSPIRLNIYIQQPTMHIETKTVPKDLNKYSLVHTRFVIMMRLASIPMDLGLYLSIPKLSSQGN